MSVNDKPIYHIHKIFHLYRNFSAILWPDNNVFQSNVQIKIFSKYKEDTKRLSENLIYEGQLTGKCKD